MDELEFIVATKCVARGGRTKWNSNTTCGAYQWNRKFGGPYLVLYQIDGCGNHFMVNKLEILESFQQIYKSVSSIVLWDLITSWFDTYSNHGIEDTRQQFMDGRLKKRKVRGSNPPKYKIWIEPKEV